MRTFFIVLSGAFLSGLAGALLFAPAAGDAQITGSIGAGDGGSVVEEVVWLAPDGKLRKATFQRAVVKVPESFGDLIHMTAGDPSSLWYANKDGVLRNVLVGSKLYLIDREKKR